ncbi:MAG: fibronectin type III domain-containing protein [Tenacibaculum sp.]
MKKIYYLFVISFIIACSSETEKQIYIPTITNTEISNITGSSATLNWEASIEDNSKLTYDLFLDNKLIISQTNLKQWHFKDLQETTSYNGKIIVKSTADETSEAYFNFTTTNHPTPSTVEITFNDITTTTATINWTEASIDNNSDILYDIYINDELKEESFNNLSLELKQLTAFKEYNIKIVAKSSNKKTSSSEKKFTTLGIPPSSFPLTIKNSDDWDDLDAHWLKINWTPPTAQDGYEYYYTIYLDDEIDFNYLQGTTNSYSFTELEEGKTYTVKIVANSSNNTTTEETITFTTIVHPEISDFEIKVDSYSATTAYITWTEATYPDGTEVNYDLYLNGEKQNPDLTPIFGLGYNLKDLSPNTFYTLKIIANKDIGHPVKSLSKEINFTTDYDKHPNLTVTEAILYTKNSTYFGGQLQVKFSSDISSISIDKFSAGDIIINNFSTYSSAILSNSLSDEKYQQIYNKGKGFIRVTENGTTYRIDFNIIEQTN